MVKSGTQHSPHGDHSIHPSDCEPVAIIGMACRFPCAPDLSAFWDLLEAGGKAISEI